MRRGLLLLSTVLICLAIAAAASAKKPTTQITPSQDDVVITDQCAFPVLGHIEGIEINKILTDDAGNPIKQIVTFPGNTPSRPRTMREDPPAVRRPPQPIPLHGSSGVSA